MCPRSAPPRRTNWCESNLFGDEKVEAIRYVDPTTGENSPEPGDVKHLSATLVTPKDRTEAPIAAIREELKQRLDVLNSQGQLLEAAAEQAHRLRPGDAQGGGYCTRVEKLWARHPGRPPSGNSAEC